jgi:hypothetical protein
MLLIRAEWKSVKVSELAEDVILMLMTLQLARARWNSYAGDDALEDARDSIQAGKGAHYLAGRQAFLKSEC